MTLALALVVIHFLADFVCQSDWMALNKSKRWDALALHVVVYAAVLFAGLWLFLGFEPNTSIVPRTMGLLVYVPVNAALHFLTDAVTSRVTSRLWFINITPTGETGKIWRGGGDGGVVIEPLYSVDFLDTRHWFFVAIGFDQVLHYTALFLTAEWWLR